MSDQPDNPILAALARLEAGQTALRNAVSVDLTRTRVDLMARMDRLFGVTMAERGVSQIVSVDLATAEKFLEAS